MKELSFNGIKKGKTYHIETDKTIITINLKEVCEWVKINY